MEFETEIVNTTIVAPEGRYRGTIAISRGRIAAVLEQPSGSAERTIDGEGLLAFPGMVDQKLSEKLHERANLFTISRLIAT